MKLYIQLTLGELPVFLEKLFFKRNSGICLQSSMLLLFLKSSGKEATLNLKQPKLWSFKFSNKTLFNAVITKLLL